MRVIHDMQDFGPAPSVVALGTFDGVHVGHRLLISEAVSIARSEGARSAAFTFDRHPLSLIRPNAVPRVLTPPEEKQALLAQLGLDVLIEQPFTAEFAALSPETFFEALYETLHPKALVVGFNYTFGRKGAGNSGLLQHLCREKGIDCRVMEPVCVGGIPVSSSRIRALLDSGDAAQAEALLGYSLSGPDSKNLK